MSISNELTRREFIEMAAVPFVVNDKTLAAAERVITAAGPVIKKVEERLRVFRGRGRKLDEASSASEKLQTVVRDIEALLRGEKVDEQAIRKSIEDPSIQHMLQVNQGPEPRVVYNLQTSLGQPSSIARISHGEQDSNSPSEQQPADYRVLLVLGDCQGLWQGSPNNAGIWGTQGHVIRAHRQLTEHFSRHTGSKEVTIVSYTGGIVAEGAEENLQATEDWQLALDLGVGQLTEDTWNSQYLLAALRMASERIDSSFVGKQEVVVNVPTWSIREDPCQAGQTCVDNIFELGRHVAEQAATIRANGGRVSVILGYPEGPYEEVNEWYFEFQRRAWANGVAVAGGGPLIVYRSDSEQLRGILEVEFPISTSPSNQ